MSVSVYRLISLALIFFFCSIADCHSDTDSRKIFRVGQSAWNSGDFDRAAGLWAPMLGDKIYGPVCKLMLAAGYKKSGNLKKSEEILNSLIKSDPSGIFKNSAESILWEVLSAQNKPAAATMLKKMIGSANDREKPALIFSAAELEKRLGNFASASGHFKTLFLNYPASFEGLKAADEIEALAAAGKVPRPNFSESEQLARAERLFAKGRFDLSCEVYEKVLKTKPSDKKLMLRLAKSKYKERHNQKAISILKDLLKNNASEADKLEAYHLLSLIYWRLDRDRDFEQYCRKILDKGTIKHKRKALFNLAAHSYEKRRFSESESYLKKVLATDPDSSLKSDVKWKLAWIKYWQENFKGAAEEFRQARNSSTGKRLENASKYWEARCLLQAGRPTDAENLLKEIVNVYPLDYYATEASRILRMLGAVNVSEQNGAGFPDVNLGDDLKKQPSIAAASVLIQDGLHEFALIHLENLPKSIRACPPVALLTAKTAYDAGRHHEAQDILSAAFGGLVENPPADAPSEFIEIAFPRIHHEQTLQLAQKFSLDPNLVWAVIRQESRYDPRAISPAGALGLMQVTPAAAGVAVTKGKVSAQAISDMLDPQQNIAHGIRILAKNFKSFQGKLVPAVASYNADIRKVRTWVKIFDKLKQDEFIESIPYQETRMYVKKVLAGYRAYGKLHEKKDLVGFW